MTALIDIQIWWNGVGCCNCWRWRDLYWPSSSWSMIVLSLLLLAVKERISGGDGIWLVFGWYVIKWMVLVMSGCLTVVGISVWQQRRRTYRKLSRAGLPTVYWRPKFLHYACPEDSNTTTTTTTHRCNKDQRGTTYEKWEWPYVHDSKLPSSSITGILPRMQKLKGPYDMYGTVYGVSTSVVHMAHPIPTNTVLLSTIAATVKEPAYDHFKNFCGEGVFTADGSDWKKKRTSVLHALLRSTAGRGGGGGLPARIETLCHDTMEQLACHLDTIDATDITDIVPILQQATIAMIYKYITDTDIHAAIHCDKNIETQITSSSSSLLLSSRTSNKHSVNPMETNTSLLHQYLRSISRIRLLVLAQSRSLWYLTPRWMYRMLANLYRQEEVAMKPIREMAKRACLHARTQPESPLALLPSLYPHLYSIVPQSSQNRYPKSSLPAKLSEHSLSKNLLDEAITLLFAGQDTSAATLSWTLHLLSLYPTVQSKLAHEIHSVLLQQNEASETTTLPATNGTNHHIPKSRSDNNPNDMSKVNFVITKKMVSKMVYLDAVIKESMRLYPVAPFIARKLPTSLSIPVTAATEATTAAAAAVAATTKEANTTSNFDKIRCHEVTLPAQSVACIWIYGLHRHPDFWTNPDDFIPERWLASTSSNSSGEDIVIDKGITTPGAYIPFGYGPRNCIGQPLAHLILRCILSQLIHRYVFQDPRLDENKLDTDAKVDVKSLRKEMQVGFTVLPQNGVHLRVKKR